MQRLSPLFVFITILVALAVVRLGMGWVSLSVDALPVANILSGILFLGGPLLGLVYAAKGKWSLKTAIACFAIGILIQVGCIMILRQKPPESVSPLLEAFAQVGLPIWCVGLGAMIATGVKDRNILIPISIFLIGFDTFLVLSPKGVVRMQLVQSPDIFQRMASQLPALSGGPATGHVSAGAYVGPADFVFLAMFMIALYRFELKAKETARLVIPVLLVYMLVVIIGGVALPALVPIGICILVANYREFKLTKDEKQSTVGLTVVVLGLLAYTWWSANAAKKVVKPSPELPSNSVPGKGKKSLQLQKS